MNPFDELELDPRLSPEELTESLRRRAERASPEERQRIQELWRTLTVREKDRLRWALLAHPRPPEADPGSVDSLRRNIPPLVLRSQAPVLVPTLADAFVAPDVDDDGACDLLPPSLMETDDS